MRLLGRPLDWLTNALAGKWHMFWMILTVIVAILFALAVLALLAAAGSLARLAEVFEGARVTHALPKTVSPTEPGETVRLATGKLQ
jgi:hypothetical protein